MSSYHREWDDRLKMFRNAPKHDWSSHGADAGRTFAAGYRHPKDQMKAQTGKIPTIGDRFSQVARNRMDAALMDTKLSLPRAFVARCGEKGSMIKIVSVEMEAAPSRPFS